MVGVLPLERAFGHDREQGPQGRAGVLDRAVLEVLAGDPLLGLGDVVDAVHEGLQVLRLGPEELLVEDAVRVVEDAAEEGADELGRDPIAQAAGQHRTSRVVEVSQRFQVSLGDQERRVALVGVQAAPDLRDQQADVVVDPHLRADVTGGGREAAQAGQDVRHQRRVQVVDRSAGR